MSTTTATITESKPLSASRDLASDSLAMGIVFALTLTVVQRLLGGVRGIVFCQLMTDQELGQWSMINSFLLILAPLAVLGLPGSFGKFVEYYFQQGQLKTFLRRIFRVCVVTTLLMTAAMFLFPEYFSQQILGESGQIGLIRLSAISFAALTAFNYLTSLIESLRQIRLATIMRFVSGVTFTIAGIVLLLVWPAGSVAAVWAFLLSSIAGSIPAVWYLRRFQADLVEDGPILESHAMWWRLIPYAAWWWASNMVYNMYELADRYLLIHFSNLDSKLAQGLVGQYHSGRVIPLLMVGVAAMLSGLILPYLAKTWGAGDYTKTRRLLNWTVKLSTLGMMAINIGLLLISPLLFEMVLQGRYNDGLEVLPLTMVYCTWFSTLTVAQDFLWVAEKGKYAVGTLLLGLIANVAFNLWLIPLYGLWGAVVATAIGNLVAIVLLQWCNARFGCAPDWGSWTVIAVPALLLLPGLQAAAAFLLLSIWIVLSNRFFSQEEKREIGEFSKHVMIRLGMMKA